MKEHDPTDAAIHGLKNFEDPCILSEFQVDNQQFLVVSLENHLEDPLPANSTSFSFNACQELSRFEVEGKTCAIVKIDQPPDSTEIDLITLLTERELQIATLVAGGRANKQIASQLHISEWTVSTHLRRIFIKLGVDCRAAMVYRCATLIQQLPR